jgi:hypothetical protein
VAEAVAVDLAARDLGDELDAKRDPVELEIGRPPARGAAQTAERAAADVEAVLPGMPDEWTEVPGELVDQLLAPRRRERGRDADVAEPPAVVPQPEQQRPDGGRLGVEAEPGEDAVDRALGLHLHHGARARLVGEVDRLHDDAVDRRAAHAGEPLAGDIGVGRRRRDRHT